MRTVAPSYRLTFRDGRPVITTATGDALAPSCYCDCMNWDFDAWTARNRDFVESGVHLYFLSPKMNWDTGAGLYWTDNGVYPTPTDEQAANDVEGQAQAILAMDPGARFFVRPGESVPKAWAAKHTGDMQLSSTGLHMNQMSLASTHWDHFTRSLTHLVDYCE